jgi:hypothetical protein
LHFELIWSCTFRMQRNWGRTCEVRLFAPGSREVDVGLT